MWETFLNWVEIMFLFISIFNYAVSAVQVT